MRTPRSSKMRVLLSTAMIPAVVAVLSAVGVSPAAAAPPKTLYVSPSGSDANPCTQAQPCATISQAVAVAAGGDTVSVAGGTYAEDVHVAKAVNVVGNHSPVVDATGLDNGFLVEGDGASGAAVTGFVVENATFEGILALQTSDVTIRDNTVTHNDQGMFDPNPQGECAPVGEIPGDCGEGLHLMTVTSSLVDGNAVSGNAGGILVSDEFGPTAHNLILNNHVTGNLYDCGITVVGHNPNAVDSSGVHPKVAGVYDNSIIGNQSDGNGTSGEGAGILLAGAGPGTAVYDNEVLSNSAKGNDLAGITLHSHAPGDDLNGNVFKFNVIGRNNLGGDPDAGVTRTTGILIFSAVTTLSGTVVRSNLIQDDYYGIWTQNVPPIGARSNTFDNVKVPVRQT